MREKPRVIYLSNIEGKYKIQESSRELLQIIINSDSDHLYADILRARSIIELRGAGNRYDGIYFVENVSHSTEKGEYKTSFTLKKNRLPK